MQPHFRKSSLMPDQHVDPAAIITWRMETASTVLVLAIAAAVPLAPLSLTLASSAFFVAAVAGLGLAWFWPPARYRRLKYRVDEVGLTIQDGVWWRTQTSLPRLRIQHSDVSQGPLQRRYGIATLKLYTAGSRYTKVELEGLRHEDALALRDRLVRREDLGG